MPIFADPGPIPTIFGIWGFWIFVSRDSGPQILGFSGPGSGSYKQLRARPALRGVIFFKNDTPLDFKGKGGQDFPPKRQIILRLS